MLDTTIKLPTGFMYAWLTKFPKAKTYCYSTSKYNSVESKIGIKGSFTVYSRSLGKQVGTSGDDSDVIYSLWLNDISQEDLDVLTIDAPVVVMCVKDTADVKAGEVFFGTEDLPQSTTAALPASTQ